MHYRYTTGSKQDLLLAGVIAIEWQLWPIDFCDEYLMIFLHAAPPGSQKGARSTTSLGPWTPHSIDAKPHGRCQPPASQPHSKTEEQLSICFTTCYYCENTSCIDSTDTTSQEEFQERCSIRLNIVRSIP